jgi:hypothetical protein
MFGQLPSESSESGRIPTECTTKNGEAVADDKNGGCGLHWRILKKNKFDQHLLSVECCRYGVLDQ